MITIKGLLWICFSHFPFCLQSNMLKSTFLFCSPLLVSVFAIQNITDDKRNGKLFSLFRCLEFLCKIVDDPKLYFYNFSVVQFPNQVCSTTSNSFSNGWDQIDSSSMFLFSCWGHVWLRENVLDEEDLLRVHVLQDLVSAAFVKALEYFIKPFSRYILDTFDATGTISQNTSYLINPGYPRWIFLKSNTLYLELLF